MLRNITGRVFATLLAGGLLALTQLSGPATVTTAPSMENVAYPAGVVTTTEMWLDHPTVRAGEANTAHVKVTSSAGTPQGLVTFRVGNYRATKPLVNGQADWSIPTNLDPGTYKVTARFNGQIYRPSGDTAYLTVTNSDGTVAGAEGEAGSANRSGTTEGASNGLPATGSDSNTVLLGVVGAGLVALGGASLIAYRRRTHA